MAATGPPEVASSATQEEETPSKRIAEILTTVSGTIGGGVVGALAGGPIGALIGAVSGAVVGATGPAGPAHRRSKSVERSEEG